MGRTWFVAFVLAVASVQAARSSEEDKTIMEDVHAVADFSNSVKEKHAHDAQVGQALDEIRKQAIELMKEVDEVAESGSEWGICGLKICKGDTPKCCKVPPGGPGAGKKYCAVKGQRDC